ncbi:MAG: phosphodiesterase [Betaproteobacteria bacterium HGW-Betaproteobacteria-7]|jgi:3',5'-cyclic AMP phosphodiesterase CpdA|nr:MAG: phosphodiesterase [Betaproteobacteria bacterium HGW-Betaproteobacteria-7]
MRIVQLSDLHLRPGRLYSGIDPWAAWGLALDRLATLVPAADLLLLTGDLADDGHPDTYRQLAESLLASRFQFAVLPGNHDHRAELRAAFAGQPWSHPELACQRVDCGEFTLLLIDSMIPGEEGGVFAEGQLAWLDSRCPGDRRVLLAMHHPPLAVGIAGMDAIACAGGERLAAWLADWPNVEAVLCGHVHRLVFGSLAGRPVITAPSTVHQVALGEGPLAYTTEPGGLLVHDWLPGQALRTHYLPLAAAPVVVYPA